MYPKLYLFESVLTAAAITYLYSKDEETRGYAQRTLSYYAIAPLVDIDREELQRDICYFLDLTEVTRLEVIDDDFSVQMTGAEAFNDLLNEVSVNFPYEELSLQERISSEHGLSISEFKQLVSCHTPLNSYGYDA